MINNQLHNSENNFLSDFILLNINEIEERSIFHEPSGKWNSVLYITGGNGILEIDFEEYIALENRIFFIERYKVWNWSKLNELQGILVQFTDSFYNQIYTGNPKLKSDQTLIGEIPPFILIGLDDKSGWEHVFDLLFLENSLAKINSKEIICLTLKVLILMYRRKSLSTDTFFESSQKKQLLNEFRKIVNNRFVSLRTTKDYAGELNITPNYLNALCQEYYYKSVSEIIQERMILEAKRLIKHSSLNIAEISYKLGFKDNSYFGRYFKKAVGVTPKEFRSIKVESTEV